MLFNALHTSQQGAEKKGEHLGQITDKIIELVDRIYALKTNPNASVNPNYIAVGPGFLEPPSFTSDVAKDEQTQSHLYGQLQQAAVYHEHLVDDIKQLAFDTAEYVDECCPNIHSNMKAFFELQKKYNFAVTSFNQTPENKLTLTHLKSLLEQLIFLNQKGEGLKKDLLSVKSHDPNFKVFLDAALKMFNQKHQEYDATMKDLIRLANEHEAFIEAHHLALAKRLHNTLDELSKNYKQLDAEGFFKGPTLKEVLYIAPHYFKQNQDVLLDLKKEVENILPRPGLRM